MCRNLFHGSILSLVAIGFASAVLAQQPAAANRTSENHTLFDMLQSRLRATGLMPGDEPEIVPFEEPPYTVPSQRQGVASNPAPVGASRIGASRPVTAAGTSPIAAGTGGTLPVASPASNTAPANAAMTSRMHQRLSAFRDSTFPQSPSQSVAPQKTAESSPEMEMAARPRRVIGPAPAPPARAQQPTLAPPKEILPKVAERPENLPSSIAERLSRPPAEPVTKETPEMPGLNGSAAPAGVPAERGTDRKPDGGRTATIAAGTKDSPSSQVLFTCQSPVLNVKTVGPERMDLGRESLFNVTIENLGAVAAEDLILAIDLPEWADLVAAEASAGTTASEAAGGGKVVLRWNVGQLAAKKDASVALRLVARQSQPFELAVSLHSAPVASAAKIAVVEPNLTLKLDGPEKVLFGKKQVYRLKLANTGTGEARGVELALLPRGTGQTKPALQAIGVLPAGEQRTVEVELTAREEGDLVVEIDATAEGDARAHLSEKILVLKPALSVEIAAPELQFVGKEITYQIVVANRGTAAAEEVAIEAVLPESAGDVSSTQEGLVGIEAGRIRWQLGRLAPQETRKFQVKCNALAAGESRMKVVASGGDGLQASAEAAVEIDAIADLALKVTDPSGPVAVGAETEYTLTVENRGSKAAEKVEVVAYFSNGVEPTSAAGANHKIGPGQVVFEAIDSIGPGETQTLVVKARADATGNHIVRAELFCKPLGTRLVAEESTYYYDRRSTLPEADRAQTPIGGDSLTAKPGQDAATR